METPDTSTKIENAAERLEKERRKRLFLFVLLIVLASVLGAGGLFLLLFSILMELSPIWIYILLSFLAFIFGAGGCSLASIKQPNKFKSLFIKEELALSPIARQEGLSFSFSLSKEDASTKLSLPPHLSFDDEEACFFQGRLDDGTIFSSCRLSRLVHSHGHPELIEGRYIEFALAKENEGSFILQGIDNPSFFNDASLSSQIETESILFNQGYVFSSLDKQTGFIYCSPKLINGVNGCSPIRLNAYLHKDKLRVYLDGYQGMKIGLSHAVNPNVLSKCLEEMEIFKKAYGILL